MSKETDKKEKRLRNKAIADLMDLRHGLFQYLHRDYNKALDMAIESLEREEQTAPKGEEKGD